jgi:hypothetical protein
VIALTLLLATAALPPGDAEWEELGRLRGSARISNAIPTLNRDDRGLIGGISVDVARRRKDYWLIGGSTGAYLDLNFESSCYYDRRCVHGYIPLEAFTEVQPFPRYFLVPWARAGGGIAWFALSSAAHKPVFPVSPFVSGEVGVDLRLWRVAAGIGYGHRLFLVGNPLMTAVTLRASIDI